MANLIVRNVDDSIVRALKTQAGQHGISAEAEHRLILEAALLKPQQKSFASILAEIPDAGRDSDFRRVTDDNNRNVFD